MNYDQIIDVRLLAPLATATAIIVTVILWHLNQRRKQISYKVLALEANSATVQIINSGHLAVVPGDYHSPIAISAGPGAEIVSATVISTVPGDLEMRCRSVNGEQRHLLESISGREATLAPVLLNDGDSVTVEVVSEDFRGGVRVTAHISGIRKVVPWRPNMLLPTLLISLGVLVMISSFFIVELPAVLTYGLSEALPAILSFLLGYTLLSAGLYGKKSARRASLEPVV